MANKAGYAREILLYAFVFILGCIIAALLWRNNEAATLLALVDSAIVLKLWHSRQYAVVFIVSAIVGPVGEMIAIYHGAWSYANPNFFMIPSWLPFLWGVTGLMAYRLGKFIK